MKYTQQQRHKCICEMVVIIAKEQGFEADKDAVSIALYLGGTRSVRLQRWINLAELCFEAAEKALPIEIHAE